MSSKSQLTPAGAVACLVALGAGAGLWFLVGDLSGQAEAWDSPRYYYTVLPGMAALSGALGFVSRGNAWPIMIAGFLGQAIGLFSEGFGNLFPIGLMFLAAFSLPCGLLAWIGGRLRARQSEDS